MTLYLILVLYTDTIKIILIQFIAKVQRMNLMTNRFSLGTLLEMSVFLSLNFWTLLYAALSLGFSKLKCNELQS